MSTDTAVDTQVKPETKTYFSANENHTINRVKPVEQVLPNGKTICTNNSDFEKFQVKFQGGFFYAKPGDLVAPNPDTGELEDVIAFLENHPSRGVEFFAQEETAPDPTEAISRMAECLAMGDGEGLKALYQHEKENWARPQVLEPILAAKAKLEQAE